MYKRCFKTFLTYKFTSLRHPLSTKKTSFKTSFTYKSVFDIRYFINNLYDLKKKNSNKITFESWVTMRIFRLNPVGKRYRRFWTKRLTWWAHVKFLKAWNRFYKCYYVKMLLWAMNLMTKIRDRSFMFYRKMLMFF